MRGIDAPFVSNEDISSLTPFEGGMAEALMDNPLQRVLAFKDKLNASKNGPALNPDELNLKFPNLNADRPMTEDEAAIIYDRQKQREEFQKAQNLTPTLRNGFNSIAGSLVGGLLDPISVGTGLGVSAGLNVAARAAGVGANTLGKRIGFSVVDNFLGNMAVEVPNAALANQLDDPYSFSGALAGNLAVSTVLGVPQGFLQHYFRATPELLQKIDPIVQGRIEAGLDAKAVTNVLDAHVAAENSGTFFPYTEQPFNPDVPFYSGSRVFTEDFFDGEHAIRADIGHERGVQLFDNENIAHAGALTAESGDAGAVFSHKVSDLKLIDGDLKIKDLGYPETAPLAEMLFQKYGTKGDMASLQTSKVLLDSLDMYRTGKLNVDEFVKLMDDLDATPLGNALVDVGLYDSFDALQKFSALTQENVNISRFSVKDAIIYMNKHLEMIDAARVRASGKQKTALLKKQRALIDNFNKFIDQVRKDIDVSAADVGTEALFNFFNKTSKTNPVKWEEMSVRQAYDEVLKMHYSGKVSLSDVVRFERALGADGIRFKADNFRGNKHSPSNGIYVFERDKLTAAGVKKADPRAVGKMTPDRVTKFQARIGDRLFDYQLDVDTKMWKELEVVQQSVKPEGDLQTRIQEIEATFEQAKKNLDQVNEFEGHLDPEDAVKLEKAKKDFTDANKIEKLMEAVKGCLR